MRRLKLPDLVLILLRVFENCTLHIKDIYQGNLFDTSSFLTLWKLSDVVAVSTLYMKSQCWLRVYDVLFQQKFEHFLEFDHLLKHLFNSASMWTRNSTFVQFWWIQWRVCQWKNGSLNPTAGWFMITCCCWQLRCIWVGLGLAALPSVSWRGSFLCIFVMIIISREDSIRRACCIKRCWIASFCCQMTQELH